MALKRAVFASSDGAFLCERKNGPFQGHPTSDCYDIVVSFFLYQRGLLKAYANMGYGSLGGKLHSEDGVVGFPMQALVRIGGKNRER